MCVCVCHNYSDTHVDAVLYETIDPITKTALKVCSINVRLTGNHYITGEAVMISSNAAYGVRL